MPSSLHHASVQRPSVPDQILGSLMQRNAWSVSHDLNDNVEDGLGSQSSTSSPSAVI